MNKRRKAAALKYESTYEAPVVTAAGAGQIAEKIIDKAKESDVPIVENKELTELLTKVDVGDNVPAELRVTFLMPATCMIRSPISRLPVKLIFRTRGSAHRASPSEPP